MKNNVTGLMLVGVAICCSLTSPSLGQSIVDQASGSDLTTIQKIVSDTKVWGIEVYNCRCEATVSHEIERDGEVEKKSEKITFYGHIDGENAYFRNDMDRLDGTIDYHITTPDRSFSGKSRGASTALTSIHGFGRVESLVDNFARVSIFPTAQFLIDPEFAASNIKVTEFQAESQDCVRIEADIDFKDTPLDVKLEFTDYGRFVMTGYNVKFPNITFIGNIQYDFANDVATPRRAEIVSERPGSTRKKTFEVSTFDRGAVDLQEFEEAAIGIEFSDSTRPRAYWVGLIALGGLLLTISVLALRRQGQQDTAAG